MPTAHAAFTVHDWTPAVYDAPEGGPALTRVSLRKVFTGDLVGESVGEGLFCGMNAPADGAGYLVSERVTGRLDGHEGTFVMQHGGIAAPGEAPRSFGSIVPGSGTGGFTGMRGEVEFGEGHTIVLTYDLP